jgi:hypothetical protein
MIKDLGLQQIRIKYVGEDMKTHDRVVSRYELSELLLKDLGVEIIELEYVGFKDYCEHCGRELVE